MPVPTSIELLETRIAPASVLTYLDWDGDTVKISASKGSLTTADLTLSNGTAGQLETLNLSGGGFEGAAISIAVAHKAPGGDGLANVGHIEATGVDLASVTIAGDLGHINAGQDLSGIPAVGTISVKSVGALALSTQGNTNNLTSVILGEVKTLKVAQNVVDATIDISGATGGVQTLTIGGSIIGGTVQSTGAIIVGDATHADGIKSVTIGGSVIGGAGAFSGSLGAFGSVGTIKIGGDILGAGGQQSGVIGVSGNLGTVAINGSVIGGSAASSGIIFANGTLASVMVKGSLFGGEGNVSGEISGVTSLGKVTIGGSVIGGGNSGTGQLFETGEIVSDGHLGSVLIKGSVVSGQNSSSGALLLSGAVLSRSADIGSVTIDGSIIGHSGSPVTIQAVGPAAKPATGADNAIGSVTVKGSVLYGNIIAGMNGALQDANADASLGKISIGGNWMASNAVAGAHQAAAPGWGAGDTLQTVGDTGLAARIASIVIGGIVSGSPESGDNFGFVAQQFGSLKIGKLTIPTASGNANLPIFLSDDVHLEQIA